MARMAYRIGFPLPSTAPINAARCLRRESSRKGANGLNSRRFRRRCHRHRPSVASLPWWSDITPRAFFQMAFPTSKNSNPRQDRRAGQSGRRAVVAGDLPNTQVNAVNVGVLAPRRHRAFLCVSEQTWHATRADTTQQGLTPPDEELPDSQAPFNAGAAGKSDFTCYLSIGCSVGGRGGGGRRTAHPRIAGGVDPNNAAASARPLDDCRLANVHVWRLFG